LIKAHDTRKPFFLYLSLQFPHKPYQVTEEYSKKYSFPDKDKNTYFGMITHADDTVKAVVGAMISKDMFKNALLVVMSDNGAPVPNSPAEAKAQGIVPDGNWPLKKGKGSVFEGGIRTVAFVNGGYLPDNARGKTRKGYMSISDWYATLAHVAGASQPQGGPVEADSFNNWAYIVGDAYESERKGLVEMAHRGSEGLMEVALIDGDWKMVVGADTCTQDKPCLYNLKEDPGETSEANHKSPEVFTTMKAKTLDLVSAAKKSAWFGLHPTGKESGNGWQDRRAFFGPHLCRAIEHAGGYVVPWADQADITFNLQNAKKTLLLE
jgi:arylsulfatase A-like enzyme